MRKHLSVALEGANTMASDSPLGGMAGIRIGVLVPNALGPAPHVPVSNAFVKVGWGDSSDGVLSQFEKVAAALEEHCLATEEAAEVVNSLLELGAAAGEIPHTPQTGRIVALATESLMAQVGVAEDLALEFAPPAVIDPITVHRQPGQTDPVAELPKETQATGLKSRIVEKAKQVWAAIVEALRKARLWLREQLRKLFDNSESLLKDIEQLSKQALENGDKKDLNQWKLFEMAIPGFLPMLYGRLAINGKWPTNLLQSTHDVTVQTQRYFNRMKSGSLYDGAFLRGLANTHNVEAATYHPEVEKRNMGLKHKTDQGSHDVWTTDEMLGGMVFRQQLSEACSGAKALQAHLHSPALERESLTIQSTPTDISAFNGYGLTIVLAAAKHLAEEVQAMRKLQPKLDQLADDMVWLAEQWAKNLTEDQSAQRMFMSAGPRMFVSEPARVVNYALTTATWLVRYARMFNRALK